MRSLAETLRKDLEARGEYVVRANANTGWFAVFPATWLDRQEKARRNGRDGPNLVIYRTKSADARDHYVIPYSLARELLAENTLTTSSVDGTRRWNLTLKDGKLRVSHRAGAVDVGAHHGAPLLLDEEANSRSPVTPGSRSLAPTSDRGLERFPPASGAGFGRSEDNRKVEEAAVDLVSETYRREGWHVESVEQERCGFDLRCVRHGQEAHVEVKGVAGTERRFVITAGELRRAREDDQFVLALVTSALSPHPTLERLPVATFRKSFTFDPVQYWAIPVEHGCRQTAAEHGAARDPVHNAGRQVDTSTK